MIAFLVAISLELHQLEALRKTVNLTSRAAALVSLRSPRARHPRQGLPPDFDCYSTLIARYLYRILRELFGMSGAEDRNSRIDGLRRQAKRCSALSDLVGEQPGAGAFAGLAAGIQAEIENLTNLQAEVYNHRLRTEVLIAEMSTLTARLKLLSNEVSFNQRSRFAAEDVREESRLCLEEAKATEEAAAKRLLAWQATTLAQIADRMSQGKRSDGD